MKTFLLISTLMFSFSIFAIEIGESIPQFTIQDHMNNTVRSDDFKNKWTVLFFYPKADTPGCTKQACAFRDNSKKITEMGVQIYGISINTVEDQKKFSEKYNLNFPLLADADAKVSKLFDVKRPFLPVAKRWTFIINPEGKIVDIGEDVDPVLDSERVVNRIKEIKKK